MEYIALLSGGASSERTVSLRSAEHVATLLDGAFCVELFDLPKDTDRFLAQKECYTLVIPLIHGRGGEDGALAGFLETLGIPYLFSGIQAHAIALDKEKTKRLLMATGVPSPASELVTRTTALRYQRPVVVKPLDGGSSVATSVANSQASLEVAVSSALMWASRVLVEDHVAGDEYTVSVIERDGRCEALPVVSILPNAGLFDFDSKYDPSKLAQERCPAPIPAALSDELQRLAVLAHTVIGCRQVSRSDFIVDAHGQAWFLEINTIPGITETSLLPKAAHVHGIGMRALLLGWIEETLRRPRPSC